MENIQSGNNEQQIDYKKIIEKYTDLVQQNQYLESLLQQMRSDKFAESLEILMKIIINKDQFSKKIIKLAEWHMQKLLEKPKKQK